MNQGLKASASSCFARFSYYGGYVGVAEMNEKQYERAIFKSIVRGNRRFLSIDETTIYS